MATFYATVRRAVKGLIFGKGDAGNLKALGVRTIELAPSASGTVVDFNLRIASTDRIDLSSSIFYDDLATSGAPTLDVGLYAVDSNITSDDDCLNDGLTLATAVTWATRAPLIKDAANAGKQAWEYVNGVTSDPGGFFDVKGIVRDAATVTNTGSIVLDMKVYND